MGNDEKYMRRCLDLAKKAEGFTYPNPLVGAVIVHNDKIIGEGFHLKAGGPHAEVVAINSVKDKELLRNSTIYVNLEPCSHHGKTPPCADLIIYCGIPNIVVGTPDSNDKVSGEGIRKLKAAGRNVTVGVLQKECRHLNRRFFTSHEKKRPYVILKWAESSDGFIDIDPAAKEGRGSYWISGLTERVLVHRWRATEQVILTGGRTVRVDNPGLNVRFWNGFDPVRVVLSRSGNIDKNAYVFKTNYRSGKKSKDPFFYGSRGPTLLFTEGEASSFPGCEVVKLTDGTEAAVQVMDQLYKMGLQSVIIEGGAETLNHFISLGLWDEARIFTGKIPFTNGVKAPKVSGKVTCLWPFDKCTLKVVHRYAKSRS
jgi:diaminohydroxyphosphoribosylaminopyrimidine deaminase/5-amino-6-(5-phosphoribosylamino)uracil reductase